MMRISLDTNILIDSPEVVFDETKTFVISFTVIRELDKLKRNPNVKRAAQQAIKNIWFLYKEDKIEILNIPDLLCDSPDEQIVQDTKDADDTAMLSNDIAVRIISKAHGLVVSDFEAEDIIDYAYKGYREIAGTVDYEKKYVPIKEMQLEEFDTVFGTDLAENEYCIIDRVALKKDIWVNKQGTVSRISQSMLPFRDANILLTPMDSIQMCALHAVFDDTPLTVIDGKIGTGKTILTLMAALAKSIGQARHKKYTQILVTKPPVSINKDLYTGFKPGSSEDKMSGHLGGIKSNLRFLLDKQDLKTKKGKDDKKEELLSDVVWQDIFSVVEIDEIQGTSIHNSILIVDEWQLLDTDTTKLVASRIAEGSKVVLVGDTEGQTYGMNRANEGFKVLYQHLGKAPEFNYIKLEIIYRSPLAAFIENVFKDR